jgi:hypothetical protein
MIFIFSVQNHCYYYSNVKFSLILLFKQNYFSIILFNISVIVFPDSPTHTVCRQHVLCFLDTFVCTSRPVCTKPRSDLKCGQWTQQHSWISCARLYVTVQWLTLLLGMWNLPDYNPDTGWVIMQCFVAPSLNSIFHTARVVRRALIPPSCSSVQTYKQYIRQIIFKYGGGGGNPHTNKSTPSKHSSLSHSEGLDQ